MTGIPRDDEGALRALAEAYANAVDRRDGRGFAALFADGGELWVPSLPDEHRPVVVRRGDALASAPAALDRYEWTFHQVVDARYAVPVPGDDPPDQATGIVRGVAHHVSAAEDVPGSAGIDTVWYLTYLDEYVREERGWRFARRALHLQWVEDRPVAVLAQRGGTGWGGGGPT